MWREIIQQIEPDSSQRCRVKGHGVLVTNCNKGSQLAAREIVAGHEEAALHHGSGGALAQIAQRNFGILTPGYFQYSTRWAPWQTDLVLKLTLLWNDLQNASQLNASYDFMHSFPSGAIQFSFNKPRSCVNSLKRFLFLFQWNNQTFYVHYSYYYWYWHISSCYTQLCEQVSRNNSCFHSESENLHSQISQYLHGFKNKQANKRLSGVLTNLSSFLQDLLMVWSGREF